MDLKFIGIILYLIRFTFYGARGIVLLILSPILIPLFIIVFIFSAVFTSLQITVENTPDTVMVTSRVILTFLYNLFRIITFRKEKPIGSVVLPEPVIDQSILPLNKPEGIEVIPLTNQVIRDSRKSIFSTEAIDLSQYNTNSDKTSSQT